MMMMMMMMMIANFEARYRVVADTIQCETSRSILTVKQRIGKFKDAATDRTEC